MKKRLLYILLIIISVLVGMTLYASADGEETVTLVDKPAPDETVFVYSGEEQCYTIEENEYYEVRGNKETNAGSYTVSVYLKDTVNTAWSDGTTETITYPFNISKATVNVEDIIFEDKTVKCNGAYHSIVAEYPVGMKAIYTGNGKSDPGVYTVTVRFESDNYEPIPSKSATLTINRASLREENENPTNDGVLLWSSGNNNGFNPSYHINVTTSDNDNFGFADGEKTFFVKSYSISVLDGDVAVSMDKTVKIQLPIPEYLKKIDFYILENKDGELKEIKYTKFTEHIVYETDELNEVAFVYQPTSLKIPIIILYVIAIILISLTVFLIIINKKNTGRLFSITPIIFGHAFYKSELTELIILSAVVFVLLSVDLAYVIKHIRYRLRNRKKKNELNTEESIET